MKIFSEDYGVLSVDYLAIRRYYILINGLYGSIMGRLTGEVGGL